MWRRARQSIGRTDLYFHDLRHSGLTWAAASGASPAELMRRGGHASPEAALRYQHATEERDRAIADALAGLASGDVTPTESRGKASLWARVAPIGTLLAHTLLAHTLLAHATRTTLRLASPNRSPGAVRKPLTSTFG